LAVRDLEGYQGYYQDLAILYEEVRVEGMKVWFFPNSNFRYGLLDYRMVIIGSMHKGLPTVMTQQIGASIAELKCYPSTREKYVAQWTKRTDDPSENIFYSAMGDNVTNYLPQSLGGIQLFCDGPTAYLAAGAMVIEWSLTFRGLRYLSNVTLPTRLVRQPSADMFPISRDSPSLRVDDEVVLLGGKQYVRIGEAKNPGPEESEADDDDDDSSFFFSEGFSF